ncbi:unnamed protein product [Candida verbasci]|uniref:RWD domain-containing protein n=1 Tax=Candida verbasci TaxID=1227364 RepID=A0A9W4U017_9ASCO|nr:unnamed protein product [Candida verbasci]
MDPLEEQTQEIEVLQSIYPDEITLHSNNNYYISIKLDCQCDKIHTLQLNVKYPPNYPNEIPQLSINNITEEDEEIEVSDEEVDEDLIKALNMSELINFEKDDLKELLNKLNEEAELNLGMPSIFALITLLKDESESLFSTKLQLKQNEFERERREKEKEESKKFIGTKVTSESFNEWRLKFRKEMQFEKMDLERFEKMHNGKLTGREIFEKGLAKDEDDDATNEDIIDNMKKVNI